MPRYFLALITTLALSTSASAHTGLFSHAASSSEMSHLLVHIAMLLPVATLVTWLGFIIKRRLQN